MCLGRKFPGLQLCRARWSRPEVPKLSRTIFLRPQPSQAPLLAPSRSSLRLRTPARKGGPQRPPQRWRVLSGPGRSRGLFWGCRSAGPPPSAEPTPPRPPTPRSARTWAHAFTLARTQERSHSARAGLKRFSPKAEETCRRPGVASDFCFLPRLPRPRPARGIGVAPPPLRDRAPSPTPRAREAVGLPDGDRPRPHPRGPPGKGHLGGARGRPERGPGLRSRAPRDPPREAARPPHGARTPALTCGGGGGGGGGSGGARPRAPGTRGWARGPGGADSSGPGPGRPPALRPPAPPAPRAGAGQGPDALPQSCGPRAGG